MSPERRRADHVRIPVRIPVVVEPKGPPAEMPTSGETENLSRGGALLSMGQATRPGSVVRVTLYLRRPVSLTLTGTVVWIQRRHDPLRWNQGLQFGEELSESIVAQIAEQDFSPRDVQ